MPDFGWADAIKWLDAKGSSDGKIQAIEDSTSKIASAGRRGYTINVGGISPTIHVLNGNADVDSQVQHALEDQLLDLVDAIQQLLLIEAQRSASV